MESKKLHLCPLWTFSDHLQLLSLQVIAGKKHDINTYKNIGILIHYVKGLCAWVLASSHNYLHFKCLAVCTLVGSTIRKINFCKSFPLPLWDVHGNIPMLDPPWNRRCDCCLYRNIDFSISREAKKLFLKFPALLKGLDGTCHLARSYVELL